MQHLQLYILETIGELFHFTNIGNMLNICRDDTFAFSSDDGLNYGYKYYMSTTRLRNGLTGYYKNMNDRGIVRIVLDADMLKTKFKIKPVDFNNNALYWAVKDHWKDKKAFDDNIDSIMELPSVENEDRVLTNQEKLNDFHKYIKEIQVNSDNTKLLYRHKIKKYCSKYNIIYSKMNDKEFELGKKIK